MSPRQAASGRLAVIPPVVQDPTSAVPDNVPLPHPPLTTPTHGCMLPLVRRNRAGFFMQRVQFKIRKFRTQEGNPLQNLGLRIWRGLTPPLTLTSTGGGREVARGPAREATGQEKI